MSDILYRFTTASEWADLSNLLERLRKSFATYPDAPVPNKKELAKRLSQCLTPELIMVHKQTLAVYEEVFKRELVSKSLPLHSVNHLDLTCCLARIRNCSKLITREWRLSLTQT